MGTMAGSGDGAGWAVRGQWIPVCVSIPFVVDWTEDVCFFFLRGCIVCAEMPG
jgi:hypothetical protein